MWTAKTDQTGRMPFCWFCGSTELFVDNGYYIILCTMCNNTKTKITKRILLSKLIFAADDRKLYLFDLCDSFSH